MYPWSIIFGKPSETMSLGDKASNGAKTQMMLAQSACCHGYRAPLGLPNSTPPNKGFFENCHGLSYLDLDPLFLGWMHPFSTPLRPVHGFGMQPDVFERAIALQNLLSLRMGDLEIGAGFRHGLRKGTYFLSNMKNFGVLNLQDKKKTRLKRVCSKPSQFQTEKAVFLWRKSWSNR